MNFKLQNLGCVVLHLFLVGGGYPAAANGVEPAKAESEDATTDFFATSKEQKEDLPEDQIFPLGRQMPLSLFSLPPADLERAKQSGFTMAGPYYGEQSHERFAKARLHNLKAFYPVGGDRDHVGLPISGEASPLSSKELSAQASAQIKAVLNDPDLNAQVAWWYLKPEELRHWIKPEMELLRIVAETARELDPQKRPVWMYEPNHRSATELAKTGQFLDVIGKGCYVNTGKANTPESRPIPHVWIRWSVEQTVIAAEQIATSRSGKSPVPIAVLEMSEDPTDSSEFDDIPNWVRHDVYLSLVCGAKGITIWSGARRRGFEQTREIFLDAYLNTVNQITNMHGLDQVFLFGDRRDDLQVQVTAGPTVVPLQINQGKETMSLEYPSVTFLNVAHNGLRYVMMVNSAEDAVSVIVMGLPKQPIKATELLDGQQTEVIDGSLRADLKPLGVQVWKLQP